MEAKSSPVEGCVFDAYGTLFDVHSAVARCAEDLGAIAQPLSDLWRQRQLEYSWQRSLMGRYVDFWRITCDSLEYACAVFSVRDEGLKERLLTAYQALDCYREVTSVLQALSAAGYSCYVFSNGTPPMLEAVMRHTALGAWLEDVVSVAECQQYKPATAVYQQLCHRLEKEAGSLLFCSANGWDVAGASCAGLRSVWVNRRELPAERLPGEAIAMWSDLRPLPDFVAAVNGA